MRIQNEYDRLAGSMTLGSRKVILGLVEYIEKVAETTPTGKLIYLETASYRDDGYNERDLVNKLEEWGVLTVEGDDEYGHPVVDTTLDKIRKIKEALKNPVPVPGTTADVRDINEAAQEKLYEEEIVFVGKLLQICDKNTKLVELVRPAESARNDPERVGFDSLALLSDLVGRYGVIAALEPSLESMAQMKGGYVRAEIDYEKLSAGAGRLHDDVESWKGTVYGIEQQKRIIWEHLQEYIKESPHLNGEPYEYTERILGSYTPISESNPEGMSLSRPDKKRPDIKFRFVQAVRGLESEGKIQIVDIEYDFQAKPKPTSKSLEAHKWSLGERSLEFYPARHCKVKFYTKSEDSVVSNGDIGKILPKNDSSKWSVKLPNKREMDRELVRLKKECKLGKKEYKLLKILSNFKQKRTTELTNDVPTNDYQHLKMALAGKIKKEGWIIENEKERIGLVWRHYYRLDRSHTS